MNRLPESLIHSRTCYKHLAGELGVTVTRALLNKGVIKNTAQNGRHCFAMTDAGRRWCEAHGISIDSTARDAAKSCLDHSHRVPHVSGKLGRAILFFMREQGHCKTSAGRKVRITKSGILFLKTALGIRWEEMQ